MKRDDPQPGSKQQSSETGPPPHEESRSLPGTSGESGVVLLPVNPDKVFAFWEITAGPTDNDNRQGDAPLDRAVLRLRESGEAPSKGDQQDTSHEVPIEPQAGSTYVSLRQAGSSCQAEIGYTDRKGRFVQAAQSEITETPRPLPRPEKTMNHQSTGGAGPLSPAPVPTWMGPGPVARPHPEPGVLPVEGGDLSRQETEEFLVKRRLAIFRHLSEAVPLVEAGSAFTSSQQAERPIPEGGMPRKEDLTEISERKFMAGISSR